jgi:hypothetical protein
MKNEKLKIDEKFAKTKSNCFQEKFNGFMKKDKTDKFLNRNLFQPLKYWLCFPQYLIGW